MDIKAYAEAAVAGVPLVFVVMGVVEWIKKLGVAGKPLTVASMGVGLVFGGGFMVAQSLPADFAGWFAVSVYGIGLGVIASGAYDLAKGIITKAAEMLKQ